MATRRYYSAIAVDNTVASGINNTATSVVLTSSPVGFPGSYPFTLALDYDTASEELVLVTGATGTTLTIQRGYNGTTAVAHNAGATVRHVIVAQDLTDFQDHAALGLTGGAHGVTGALATFLGTPSSANLAAVISDETGTGPIVFSQSPSIATPTISGGTVTGATSVNETITGATVSGSTFAIGVNANTGTAYTLASTDQDKLVTLNNANPVTVTIPAGTFSTGAIVNIQQVGAGQVSVTGATGAAFSGTGTKLRAQYSAASIVCTGSNTFTLIGDIL